MTVTFDQLLKGRHKKKDRLLVKRSAEFLSTDVDLGGQVKIQNKTKVDESPWLVITLKRKR